MRVCVCVCACMRVCASWHPWRPRAIPYVPSVAHAGAHLHTHTCLHPPKRTAGTHPERSLSRCWKARATLSWRDISANVRCGLMFVLSHASTAPYLPLPAPSPCAPPSLARSSIHVPSHLPSPFSHGHREGWVLTHTHRTYTQDTLTRHSHRTARSTAQYQRAQPST